MAVNITQEVENIRNATYARDVRNAMADSLAKMAGVAGDDETFERYVTEATNQYLQEHPDAVAPTDEQVNAWLDANGVTTGATAEQAEQIQQNTQDIRLFTEELENNINSLSLWESGQINSDGTNNTNNTRIRTISYIPDNVIRVKADDQANVRAQLYAADGTFVKVSDLGFTQDFLVADVLAEDAQASKIRLIARHVKTTTAIDTDYAEHIQLLTLTDTELTAAGKSADAAATGAAIAALEKTDSDQQSRICSIDHILSPVWEQGHIKTADGTDGLPTANSFALRIRTGFLPEDVQKITTSRLGWLYLFRYDKDGNFVDYIDYEASAEVTDFDHSQYLYRAMLRDGLDYGAATDLSYTAYVKIENKINRPLVRFEIDYTMRDVSGDLSGVDLSADTLSEKTLEQVYSLFDGLVTAYPDYVTKSDAAGLCSMTYPDYANGVSGSSIYEDTPAYQTYLYKFSESNECAGNDGTCRKAKLLMICGVHGNEYAAPYNAYLFAKQLCDSVLTDENFFKLRAAFDIYIIPCLNGYGMYHGLRGNANGVNINRNFPVEDWKVRSEDTKDTAANNYSGPSAGSEFETQLVMNITDLIQPDMCIDHHNYNKEKWQFYTTVCDYRWLGLMYQSLVDCSCAFKKNYPQYFGTGFSLLVDKSGAAPSSVSKDKTLCTASKWWYESGMTFAATVEAAVSINYTDGVYTDTTTNYYGMDTLSVAEYTLRNVVLHAGQYVLDNK